jgi:hypothetical protein
MPLKCNEKTNAKIPANDKADFNYTMKPGWIAQQRGLKAALKKPAPNYKGRTFTDSIILHYPLIHSQSISIPVGHHKTDCEQKLHLAIAC